MGRYARPGRRTGCRVAACWRPQRVTTAAHARAAHGARPLSSPRAASCECRRAALHPGCVASGRRRDAALRSYSGGGLRLYPAGPCGRRRGALDAWLQPGGVRERTCAVYSRPSARGVLWHATRMRVTLAMLAAAAPMASAFAPSAGFNLAKAGAPAVAHPRAASLSARRPARLLDLKATAAAAPLAETEYTVPEWRKKVDLKAWADEVRAVERKYRNAQGDEDVKHMKKMLNWTYVLYAIGENARARVLTQDRRAAAARTPPRSSSNSRGYNLLHQAMPHLQSGPAVH